MSRLETFSLLPLSSLCLFMVILLISSTLPSSRPHTTLLSSQHMATHADPSSSLLVAGIPLLQPLSTCFLVSQCSHTSSNTNLLQLQHTSSALLRLVPSRYKNIFLITCLNCPYTTENILSKFCKKGGSVFGFSSKFFD